MQADRRRGARRRPTYANVMSTLAVFLVLAGGTAIAAGLPKGSVDSRTVKNNSLTGADLKNGSVTRADLSEVGFIMLEGENSVMVEPGKSGQVTAECPEQNEEAGRAISGSAYFQNESGYIWMSRKSLSAGSVNKWIVAGTNTGKTPQKLTARALCILFV